MGNQIIELFAVSAQSQNAKWASIAVQQQCSFIKKKCVKVRKSEPAVSIGTCTVMYGKSRENVIICPFRLIENNQIFLDCIHLLTLHEPGNELHIVPEVVIPGGSVDYVLVSARNGKVKDFVGIELQALDTSGSVWGNRQSFLRSKGVDLPEYNSGKAFGVNWKMTAKTILVQMHHKVITFENLNKHLVLVTQNCLLEYMKKSFSFEHVSATAKLGDSFHFHAYTLLTENTQYRLSLSERTSTDADGIAKCLGLKAEANVKLDAMLQTLENKISAKTLLKF